MDSYTITITPDDNSGNHTTLTVDTSTGQARITNVHLHAPAGLTGGQIPSVDVGLLLQAITGPTHTPTAITAAPTPASPAALAAPTVHTDASVAEPSAAATATAPPQPASNDTPPAAPAPAPAVKRASPRRAAAARPVEGKAAPSSGARSGRKQQAPTKAASKQAASKNAAPRKAAGKQATAAAAGGGTGRVYRRMPSDFAAVYRQAGTASAIADHYGVPRYTAQGWISRLKKQDAATER